MSSQQVDCLILGQGIAGSCMALELLKRGRRVLVVDNQWKSAASTVATGVYNPIGMRLLNHSWLADKVVPFAHEFYGEAEKTLDSRLLSSFPFLRLFTNRQERDRWKASDNPYLGGTFPADLYTNIHAPHGYGLVRGGGTINVPLFLKKVKEHLIEQQAYATGQAETTDIAIQDDRVSLSVGGHTYIAPHMVFCQGLFSPNHRFFGWLPFQPAKGETIRVKMDLRLEHVIRSKVFVLPTSNDNEFHIGATYAWNDLDPTPRDEGVQELREKLQLHFQIPYQITATQAGIRPTVKDRRPFVGAHPRWRQLLILNGLGTRGILLAPYFAHQLAEHMYKQVPVHLEASIDRYLHAYSPA